MKTPELTETELAKPRIDPPRAVSPSEFYRTVGLLYFFAGMLSFTTLNTAGFSGNLLWLASWFLVVLAVFMFSIRYLVRSVRERKCEEKG